MGQGEGQLLRDATVMDGGAPRIDRVSPSPGVQIVDKVGLEVVEIGFDRQVAIPPYEAIRVWGVRSGPIEFERAYDPRARVLRLHLEGAPRDDLITIVIDDRVTSPLGTPLDGEIANPASPLLPSGDGQPGGVFVVRYRVLQGDADRDGVVDLQDQMVILESIDRVAGEPGFDPRADLDGDGAVNFLDLLVWVEAALRLSLPVPDADPPALVALDPPAGVFDAPIARVRATFDKELSPRHVDPRALHATDRFGVVRWPASVEFEGDALLFAFDPPLEACNRYRIGLSGALADESGALLAPLAPRPIYDALVPPAAPTITPPVSPTTGSTVVLSGLAQRAAQVEATGPGGTVRVDAIDGSYVLEAPLRADSVNTIFVTAISACGVRSAPVTTRVVMDTQPPTLHIDFPSDGGEVTIGQVTVAGRVGDMLSGFMGLSVMVNGVAAIVDPGIGTNGTFEARGVPLNPIGQPTRIEAVATDAMGNRATRAITITRVEIPPGTPSMAVAGGADQTGRVGSELPEPIEVLVLRGDGSPFAGKVVTFDVTRSDGRLSATPGGPGGPGALTLQVAAGSDGVARAWWTLGTDAGCGNNRVTATSRDIAGSAFFCASAQPGPASQINVGMGGSQRGEAGTFSPMPLRVFVHDGCNGVSDLPVEFRVVAGDGTFEDGSTRATALTALTGHAEIPFIIGQTPGVNRVQATFDGNPNAPAEFVLTGLARDPERSASFTGIVLDNAGQPIEGALARLVVNGVEIGIVESDINGQFGFFGYEESGMADLYVDGSVATGVGGPERFRPVEPFSFPSLHYEFLSVSNATNSLGEPVLLPLMNPANIRHYSTTEPTILECEGIEGLRMIIEPGSMTMPDGTPALDGQVMALNQVHHDDIPMPMPDGAAPPFAWTIYPPEATFDPPIRVEYPNMSGLAPGAIAYFLTFDHGTGNFEIVASGSVTPDGSTIITDPGSGITLSGWGCNCPPYSVAGDCCVLVCSDSGRLSGGDIDVRVIEANTIVGNISGVIDSGGMKSCEDITEPVPPGMVTYRYEVRGPGGELLEAGNGSSFQFDARQCGQHEVVFIASVSRECAPDPIRLSRSVMVGDEPVLVGNPTRALSYRFDGIDLFLVELPPIIASLTANAQQFEACCFEPGGSMTALFEDGSVEIRGSIEQAIDIPVPGAGTLVRLIDRVVCDAIGRRVPFFECDVGIRLRADGFFISANGQYAANNCPEFDFVYTELGGATGLVNPRLEVVIELTILGQTGGLSAVVPSSVEGRITTDGKNMLFGLFDSGGRIALSGQLPIIGEFEIIGIDYPPFIATSFSIALPDPADLQRLRFGPDTFEATAEPLPRDQWPQEWLPKRPTTIDERWELAVGAQNVPVPASGPIRINNIAAPDLFGPGGPGTAPDFLSDDFLRVTGTAEIDGKTWYAQSEPFQIRQGETFVVGDLIISDVPPLLPESIRLDPCDGCEPTIEIGQQLQMATTATLGDGSQVDVTARDRWTVYRTSNPSIATVGPDGLVTAHAAGRAIVTAVNESATATRRIFVTRETAPTTIRGFVVGPDGEPFQGALVTLLAFGGEDTTSADGSFSIDTTVPGEGASLTVVATATIGEQQLFGTAASIPAVLGGVTDAGVIALAPLCENPQWAEGLFGVRGMNDDVFALTVFDDGSGPALYAGGIFTTAGGVSANRIARWDGSAWTPLGSGMNGTVLALTVFDDGSGPALYAGGSFTTAGGVEANRIARWDGSAWSPLGSGMSSDVSALTVFDDGTGEDLYAGGLFTTAGGVTANRIARWDGSAWSPLGSGMEGGSIPRVFALTSFDDGSGPALYAGGDFTTAGGESANRIARWDGSAWAPLGSGMDDFVSALTVFDDGSGPALYAGGWFTTAGGESANRIARWDGSAWTPLGSGMSSRVDALTVFDDGSGPALYAGGSFTTAGGVSANRIARWDGSAWSPLGSGMRGGPSPRVRALTVFDDGSGPALYAGGSFTTAGGVSASRIARWDGAAWSPLGSGMNDWVRALTVFDDGSGPALYAGGIFTTAGGVSANRIARWDGSAWTPLGSGMEGGSIPRVFALTSFDDGSGPALYAGGDFTTAGGESANRIARWDGSAWSSLGGALNDRVSALTVFDDGSGPALYAGGWFTTAGGESANRIARWDGSAWTPLGSGMSGRVDALTVFDDGTGEDLYAGGLFTTAGGVTANRIARWDGSAWSPLGSGMSGEVSALTAFDDGSGPALYAGGFFTTAGGVSANRIARWDGAAWSPLGSGMNGSVRALTAFDDGTGPALYAGGDFTTAGGVVSAYMAKWGCGPLGATAGPGLMPTHLATARPRGTVQHARPPAGLTTRQNNPGRGRANPTGGPDGGPLANPHADPHTDPADNVLLDPDAPLDLDALLGFIEDLGPVGLVEPGTLEIQPENRAGLATGALETALGRYLPYLATPTPDGPMTDLLGLLPEHDPSAIPGGVGHGWGLSIDDHGRVVGVSAAIGPGGEDVRAVLWTQRDGAIDLGALLPDGSGWLLHEAVAFDDASRIVGVGTLEGRQRAFRLTLRASPPRGDLNGDGRVDTFDLLAMLAAMEHGDPARAPGADLNGDGAIDLLDAALLMELLSAGGR